MQAAKFEVGQVVAVDRAADGTYLPGGSYAVLRVMPASENGWWSYRVRSAQDGQERVVLESQMRRPDGAAPTRHTKRSEDDGLFYLL
jgi:hypothetical protein